MEAIIGYTLSDLGLALNAVEEDLPHGGSVRVELCSEQLPSHDAIYDFHLGMVASGAHVSYPEAQVI
ncbi:MAG: hypothetical protein Q8R28_04905, partial [Dehalococcoidia bacterium]|nr:hypothetical protein [Dehalococcoidia bacterium]